MAKWSSVSWLRRKVFMIIKATQKYTRQTPRKLRLVANAVKDLSIEKALNQLAVIERRATVTIAQVLRQAIANATHNHGYQLSDLSIDTILVNPGPIYRRFRPVSRGRAHGLIKRTSHITVILKTNDEKVKTADVKPSEAVVTPTETKEVPTKVKVTKKPKVMKKEQE